MLLGEKIYSLRKEKGLSKEELAMQLTISVQAISKWELSESVPDTEIIVQLSRLFNVTTDYLLIDEYNNGSPIKKVKKEFQKAKIRSKTKIASYWLIGIGLFGFLTINILSFAIPAMKVVYSDRVMTITEEVRGELIPFLQWFYLLPFYVMFCMLAISGIVLLLYTILNEKSIR